MIWIKSQFFIDWCREGVFIQQTFFLKKKSSALNSKVLIWKNTSANAHEIWLIKYDWDEINKLIRPLNSVERTHLYIKDFSKLAC